MTHQESNQSRTEPDEPIATESGAEDIEIDAEDAETVTGGQTGQLLWIGSRTDGHS